MRVTQVSNRLREPPAAFRRSCFSCFTAAAALLSSLFSPLFSLFFISAHRQTTHCISSTERGSPTKLMLHLGPLNLSHNSPLAGLPHVRSRPSRGAGLLSCTGQGSSQQRQQASALLLKHLPHS